jgi:hypothetical protein
MFLQDVLESAGRDESRLRERPREDRIREMKKRSVPDDISVADFVRRPDPPFEQQRREVAKALGWRP